MVSLDDVDNALRSVEGVELCVVDSDNEGSDTSSPSLSVVPAGSLFGLRVAMAIDCQKGDVSLPGQGHPGRGAVRGDPSAIPDDVAQIRS